MSAAICLAHGECLHLLRTSDELTFFLAWLSNRGEREERFRNAVGVLANGDDRQ